MPLLLRRSALWLLLLSTVALAAPAQGYLPTPTVTALNAPTGFAAAGGTTLQIHDFTGDGIADVITDPQYRYVIAVGRGDGTFDPTPIQTGVASEIFTTILGVRDVNGDGLDEVFSYHVDNRARWSLFVRSWMPPGSLVPVINVPAQLLSQSSNPLDCLCVEDLDGDGRVELLQLPGIPGPMRIWRFTAAGMADVTPSPAPTYSGRRGALGDVDGDGLLDVVAFHSSSGNPQAIELRLQTPGLGFAAAQLFSFPTSPAICQPCALVIPRYYSGGDVDGDGLFDFVVTGRQGATPATLTPVAWVFRGDRAGTLLPLPPVAPPAMLTFVRRQTLHDLDLDGALDLVHGPNLHRLHPAVTSTGGTIVLEPTGIDEGTLGDLDGDGDPDLIEVVFPPAGSGVTFGLAVSMNPTVRSAPCIAPGGLAPRLRSGTPAPGNAGFALTCDGLTAGTATALCLSLSSMPTPLGGCVFGLGLSPGALLLPTGSLGLVSAAPTGTATFALPLPSGAETLPHLWAQWLVLDPSGPGQLGGTAFSLSDGRRLRIW